MDIHQPDALAVANYMLELAKEEGKELQPLKLMKLVYIAHGFTLALLGRSALNPRFDRVEAWQYGPVIPSVYHSFKSYGRNRIDAPTTILVPIDGGRDFKVETPRLKDKDLKAACRAAYIQYSSFEPNTLVDMLHKEGSPWSMCYLKGANEIIPDSLTKIYYEGVISRFLNKVRSKQAEQ